MKKGLRATASTGKMRSASDSVDGLESFFRSLKCQSSIGSGVLRPEALEAPDTMTWHVDAGGGA